MNRSEKLVRWLASQDGPRTSRQMRDAVDPGADAKTIHAVISSMVKRGKVIRVGSSCGGRKGTAGYVVTDDALKDRRFKAASRAKAPPRKPTIAQRPTFDRKPTHGPMDVAADVRAFLAAGGKVQRLSRYDTSRPFKRIHPERVPNLGTSVPNLSMAA